MFDLILKTLYNLLFGVLIPLQFVLKVHDFVNFGISHTCVDNIFSAGCCFKNGCKYSKIIIGLANVRPVTKPAATAYCRKAFFLITIL